MQNASEMNSDGDPLVNAIKRLEDAPGVGPVKKVVRHDLDRFFATWSKKEAEAFDRALKEQRQIDPEVGR
jgi:hypothetical protein